MGVTVKNRYLLLLSVALLAACAGRPSRMESFDAALPVNATPPPATGGAIYQAGYDMPLFENSVAHRVGDVLTILLEEKTDASKSASTTTAKKTKADLPGPTIFGGPITVHGKEIFAGSMNNASSFDGSGDSKQSNVLNGSISVTIVKRLGNGNLLVRGQKMININQGSEYVRLQGIVRIIDIAPDNTVVSSSIADARLEFLSEGDLTSASKKGWLSKLYESLRPF